MKDRLHQNIS